MAAPQVLSACPSSPAIKTLGMTNIFLPPSLSLSPLSPSNPLSPLLPLHDQATTSAALCPLTFLTPPPSNTPLLLQLPPEPHNPSCCRHTLGEQAPNGHQVNRGKRKAYILFVCQQRTEEKCGFGAEELLIGEDQRVGIDFREQERSAEGGGRCAGCSSDGNMVKRRN
ncbi:unnamed protein product [Pleuronectes platessa]|uniref:Uncharacterized protein n=1 Tax=Pleuronectes platessa TaxID=8262 RepID=A0A9N7YVY6_PLEPL|nr:unnamed protein product [Pleuronectes platessa]